MFTRSAKFPTFFTVWVPIGLLAFSPAPNTLIWILILADGVAALAGNDEEDVVGPV